MLGRMAILCLIMGGPNGAAPFYMLTGSVPLFPQTRHRLSWSVIFHFSHLGRCEAASHVVLTGISLMPNTVKHLLMCLLAVRMASLEK